MAVLESVRESALVHSSQSPVQSLAFTHDMGLMATGDTERLVKVWYQGNVIYELNLASTQDKIRPTERIRGLVFSPTGDTLYVACGDTVKAYSMTNGEVRWMFRPARSFGFLIVSPIALSVSPAGELAVATDAGRLSLWTPAGAMRSHWWDNDGPRQLAFLDEERIVGCDSFSLCTWKIGMSRKLTRKRLNERIYGFTAAPIAGRVCLRSIHSVDIWDVDSDTLVASHPVPFGPPLIATTADGKEIFIGGTTEITSISLEDGATQSFKIEGASVRALALQPDDKALVAGCSDGSLRIWDLA